MKQTFRIDGLDCCEEVQLIEKILHPLKGVQKLNFDVFHGRLTVHYDPKQITHRNIQEKIASTGMRVTLWKESPAEHQSFWSRHGRLLLTVCSGFFLILGATMHLSAHGHIFSMLGPYQEISYSPGAFVLGCYIAAMIGGLWHVLPRAFRSLKAFHLDMNVLMTLAVIGALFIQEWFEAATVTFLFALANLLEHFSLVRAKKAVSKLMDLSPMVAFVIESNGRTVEKNVEEVPLGATILVRPGDKIPLDAVVIKGESSVNQAPITGESIPVHKKKDDRIYAGTMNEEGILKCKVTKTFENTTLSRIIRMVQSASAQRAKTEKWVEKFSKVYTPTMIAIAITIIVLPPLFYDQSWVEWLYRGLVILVIACPCALVISTPVSVVSAITFAARQGILIKGGVYLEIPAGLKAVAIDKTGTVTYGRPKLQKIVALQNVSDHEVLQLAATLEQHSDHPLATAITSYAKSQRLSFKDIEDFKVLRGKGAVGMIEGQRFWIGSRRLMHEKNLETPDIHHQVVQLEDSGHTVIAMGDDQEVIALFSLSDSPRRHAKETFQALKKLGIEKTVMLTGDQEKSTKELAQQLKIDGYYAELLPEDKVEKIQFFVEKYKYVAMVGDGVNDAPAMAASTLGIAMGSIGSDVAIETADVALMTDDLSKIPMLIRLSKKTLRIIKQNIIFALSLKCIFIGLALIGLASLWMAIAADTGASFLVISNAMRLLGGKKALQRDLE